MAIKEIMLVKIFIAEKIIGNNSEIIYEKGRKIIVFGVREVQSININVYEDKDSLKVFKLVSKLAECYGIKRKLYLIPGK